MAEDKDFYKGLIDNLSDGVYFVDRERIITYWNKGAERITGYLGAQVVGHSCRDNLLNHITADGIQLCQSLCPLAACMKDGNVHEAEVFLHHADGHRLPVLVRGSPVRDPEGKIIGAVEIFSIATETLTLRRQVRVLRRTARIDTLTKIGNRQYLEGRLRAVIAEFKDHTPAAGLLFIDIDHFKQCNDTYGHDAGDKVLCMVASTLYYNMRKTDIVGRWGGEEFLAILYDVASSDELTSIAEKLRILVESSRVDLTNTSLTITISVGATLLLPTDTPASIVHRADQLMYKSKQRGRNRVSVG
jgi:diguanylate cyclase (GGDEF)-like protein/PAS domain S-box-containing protein